MTPRKSPGKIETTGHGATTILEAGVVTGHGPSAAASGVNSFYHCANRPKGTRIRLEALFAIVLYMGESPTLARASAVTGVPLCFRFLVGGPNTNLPYIRRTWDFFGWGFKRVARARLSLYTLYIYNSSLHGRSYRYLRQGAVTRGSS
jgi:hypothetical protein